MTHGVTPEPPAGSEHYREGWRDGYEQAMQGVRDRGHVAAALSAALENSERHIETIEAWERDRAELERLRAAIERVHAVLDTRDGQRPPWKILDDIEKAVGYLAGELPSEPIDLPARFRKAADEAGLSEVERAMFLVVAGWAESAPPDVVEAIGRALLGKADEGTA